jgi:hypothetical protein
MLLGILPVRELCDRERSFKLGDISKSMGKLPVRPLPDRCRVCSNGIWKRQRGMPWLMENELWYDEEIVEGKIFF